MRAAGVVKKAPPTREELRTMMQHSRLATLGEMPAVRDADVVVHRASRR